LTILQDLWSQKEQIRLCKIHEIGEDFGAGSVVGEWKERAESLRQKKQYEEAALAYQKAAMKHNADVMMAYHQQVVARSAIVSGNKKTNRAVLFATAANSFWCCALSVLCPAGKSHRYLKKAGDCFVEGGNLSRAADAFDLAGKWDDAAQCYKLAKRFEDLSRLLQRPEVVISPDLQNEMQDLVRIYFVKQQNYRFLPTCPCVQPTDIFFQQTAGAFHVQRGSRRIPGRTKLGLGTSGDLHCPAKEA